MIIDIHGHYTTAPKALEDWRNQQIAGIKDPALKPRVADLKISDDALRESIELNQLAKMRERGSDLTIFSPRASFMAHHIGDFEVSSTWAAICNELCFRVAQLFPDHFIPAAMLPQSPGGDPKTCVPELVKCVEEDGNVAINLNPDPSGGHWKEPPLTDRHWYPIYEKMGTTRAFSVRHDEAVADEAAPRARRSSSPSNRDSANHPLETTQMLPRGAAARGQRSMSSSRAHVCANSSQPAGVELAAASKVVALGSSSIRCAPARLAISTASRFACA